MALTKVPPYMIVGSYDNQFTYSMIYGAPANILDYGADPTGTDDSTAAIQEAIDNNNSVYIPEGNFKISGLVIDTNNVTIIGAGVNASILTMDTSAAVAIDIGKTANTEQIYLAQFSIIGNSSNLGGVRVGSIANNKYVAFCQLNQLYIRGFSKTNGYGVSIDVAQELEINNCFIGYNYDGVYRPTGGFCTSTKISGKRGYIGRNTNKGVHIYGLLTDIHITDVVIEENAYEGIYVASTAVATTEGCKVWVQNCYFELNCTSNSGTGHIYACGGSGSYERHKLTITGCDFHTITNGSIPFLTMDYIIGGLISQNSGISPQKITTSSNNIGCVFIANAFDSAADFQTGYSALSGAIIALDTPFSNTMVDLTRYTTLQASIAASAVPNNTLFWSNSSGKLAWKDDAGVAHDLY